MSPSGPSGFDPATLSSPNHSVRRGGDSCSGGCETSRRRSATIVAPDGREREVDLLAISRDALIVGELKARSAAFRRTHVRDLAGLARDLNADALLLGSLDDWSEEHREKATAWVGSGLEAVVVGRADLLPSSEPRQG